MRRIVRKNFQEISKSGKGIRIEVEKSIVSEKSDSATFQLAVLRTELSNSATLLSHTQASIGLMVSALAFMKLFDSYLIFDLCGWIFIILATGVFTRGVLLYRKTKTQIEEEKSFFRGIHQ
jgi:uncharacterized membrane protein YidH (DUF202 family)